MPGGSSAAKEEPAKVNPPPPLLGAVGGTEGGAGPDDHVDGPVTGPLRVLPAPAPVAEGACPLEKYSLLVRIFTAHNRWSLEPHAWVEDLLKDFFQSILGINLSHGVPYLLWQLHSGSGHFLGRITSLCPPIDRHTPLDRLHDRCRRQSAHPQGSPT